jgi:Fic family protein
MDKLTIHTARSGHFTFHIGVDITALTPLMDRVNDAKDRFNSVPLVPDFVNRLENHVLVSSIHGTDTIEGGTLSTRQVEENIALPPEKVKEETQKRIVNLKAAYKMAEDFAISRSQSPIVPGAEKGLLAEQMFLDLHRIITTGLIHPRNVPGKYRDDEKGLLTKVGDAGHGGTYVPPKPLVDIELLMKKFIEWINSPGLIAFSPLIRAPLAHYYFERIHPFADGNGRVGRIIEAIILKAGGFRYASHSMSGYYLKNLHEYFAMFNAARKSEEKKEPYPNTGFVRFFLKGMLTVINENHDYVNLLLRRLLFESRIKAMFDGRTINHRQYTLVSNLLAQSRETFDVDELEAMPWYGALYKKRTQATRYRDFQKLEKLNLLAFEQGRKIVKIKTF